MGGDQDASAVVDWLGAVHGVDDLRVVDASIFPEIPSTPTNVTVIMAAEHIAARITAHNLKLRAWTAGFPRGGLPGGLPGGARSLATGFARQFAAFRVTFAGWRSRS